MNTPWTSLLWKEWREHAGKLLALCVIAAVAPVMFSIANPENIFDNVAAVLTILVPLSAMFTGMGVAASEQSRGTIRFLQGLPTPMAKPAAAKLLLAVLTVSVPIVAAFMGGVAYWNFVGDGNYGYIGQNLAGKVWMIESWQLGLVVAGVLGAVSILIWMAAAGVNLSDEVRAGAVGMLTIAGMWAIASFLLVQSKDDPTDPDPMWFRIVAAALPGGAAMPDPGPQLEIDAAQTLGESSPSDWPRLWPLMAAAAISNGAMAVWFLARFGRVATGRRQLAEPAPKSVKPAWLDPPRRSPLAAILWKQMRETLPLAVMGAAVILCVAFTIARLQRLPDRSPLESIRMLFIAWMIVGTLVSIVAGIGVFMDDLRPGLHAFWRSRPVSIDQWFFAKVSAGALATVTVLALPPLAAAGYFYLKLTPGEFEEGFGAALLVGLWVQLGIFAAAIAAITLVRQPVYAAILALGAAALVAFVAEWMDVRLHLSLAAILGWVAVAAVAAIVAAWIAVRKDWGWKG